MAAHKKTSRESDAERKTVHLTFRPKLYAEIKKQAARHEVGYTYMLRQVVTAWLRGEIWKGETK